MNGINEDLLQLIKKGPYRTSVIEGVRSATHNESVTANIIKSIANDKRCMRELRGAPPLVV